MELIHCKEEHLDLVSELYSRVVRYLEETINYPKWSKEYPCRESVENAIRQGCQYACVEGGSVLGAFVLNDNPDGDYAAGAWQIDLAQGMYLVIHTLAVEPSAQHKGIGGYMVDRCIEIARRSGARAIRLDVVPGNVPAQRLYQGKGFTFAGEVDLQRHIEEIPLFELYELNFE